MNRPFTIIDVIIAILSLGILGCLIYIGTAKIDNQSAALVSIILTILSIAASYITSQHFSEKGHKEAIEEVKAQHVENLKTYAINAAEKVDNLSKELHRLANYLEDELTKEYDDFSHGFRARTEKIESSVHIIETLKSVNDTSLSDWRGVIPEELEEKEVEVKEREEELKDLIARIEELGSLDSREKTDGEKYIKHEIKSLKQEIIDVTRKIDGVRIRPIRIPKKPLKESVCLPCPACQKEISYQQRPMPKSFKPLTCQVCGAKFTARWYAESGFVLEPDTDKEENIICPGCAANFSTTLSSLVFSIKQLTCPHCNSLIKLTRNINNITAKNLTGLSPQIKYVEQLSEETIQKILDKMPPQPWPKGANKIIIEELKLTTNVYNQAIKELMRRGLFHPQIDGVLYYRKDENPD